jgi:hypothetical protein
MFCKSIYCTWMNRKTDYLKMSISYGNWFYILNGKSEYCIQEGN